MRLFRSFLFGLFLISGFCVSAADDSAEHPSTATLQLSYGQQRMQRLVYLSTYRHQLNLYAGPFLEMDHDHDNTLTEDEALAQGRSEALKRNVDAKGLQSQHRYLISQLDVDGDGKATLEELRQKAKLKADAAVEDYLRQIKYDSNGDGLLKGQELQAVGVMKMKEKFKEDDTNNDGRWTIEEIYGKPTIEESAARFKGEKIRQMQIKAWKNKWQQLDLDGDGYATLDDHLRVYKNASVRVHSKYSQRPDLNPNYTLFKERVRFAETGRRSVEILKKYGTKK